MQIPENNVHIIIREIYSFAGLNSLAFIYI